MDAKKTFGGTVRKLRLERKIGLRSFAAKVGMSPTYLSKIERDDFSPPGEEKVVAIAKALDQDPDELLALGNRVASDLTEIIKRRPKEIATFLRTVSGSGISAEGIRQLTKKLEQGTN